MKDIPVFTTDWGIASLMLKEIPYRRQAYIRLVTVQAEHVPEALEECVKFCVMAGAERVFAAGEGLENYPVFTSVIQMQGRCLPDPQKIKCLFPVTDETVGHWRKLCNERMSAVDCASTLTAGDEKRLVQSSGAYFVHDAGQLLGVGLLEDSRLLLMASVKPGMGETVMHTLMSLMGEDTVTLDVASTNLKALRLYTRLGFFPVREVEKWYCVYPEKM